MLLDQLDWSIVFLYILLKNMNCVRVLIFVTVSSHATIVDDIPNTLGDWSAAVDSQTVGKTVSWSQLHVHVLFFFDNCLYLIITKCLA